MNRNVESHFSMLPSADIDRSRFDRSQDIKFTGNVGDLIPFYVDEVLPGDTFDITTSKVVRLQTLLTPVMDNIYLDTYFFFIPNRLVFSHWRELMGENNDSAWIPQVEYSVPQIYLQDSSGVGATDGDGAVQTGDVLDYMGVPVGVSSASTGSGTRDANAPEINALPLRAYQLVYNEWFRDENLVDPVNIQKGDTSYNYYQSSVLKKPYKAAKYHDYFTSALPSPQKGDPVRAPVYSLTSSGNIGGFKIPVYSINDTHDITWPGASSSKAALTGHYFNSGSSIDQPVRVYSSNFSDTAGAASPASFVSQATDSAAATANSVGFYPNNLYGWFTSGTGGALMGMDINDLRYAFQLQKLYERDARGGTRYIELIRSHFGVDSPDARLQRPEYLGGNRIPVSIHQITNQSQGESDFLGDVGAMSLTTDKHGDFVKSFTEHGILLGLCVMRYDHSYPQGLERMWSRKSRFDYYWPVFANLGEQAVLKKEIYLSGTSTDNTAFGYQERWAEYRYKPNRVAGEMRPGISNTLASWHFADYYNQAPSLSSSWIAEDKSNVDRTLAVTSTNSNQFFADIYVQNFTTRPMPLYSIPGLIDHH